MKRLWLTLALISLCLPLSLGKAGELPQRVSFSKPSLSFEQMRGYDVVKLQGCHFTNQVGAPLLPVRNIYIRIPPDAKVTGVKLTKCEYADLPGVYNLYPTQPSIPISHSAHSPPFVKPDPSIYSSPAPYPTNIIRYLGLGNLCGERIATLQLHPLQYIPSEGRLRLITQVEFKLQYLREGKVARSLPHRAGSEGIYHRVVRRLVLNPDNIGGRALGEEFPKDDLLTYLIITDANLAPVFTPLAQWKTKKGVPTAIRTVSWIDSHYNGSDLAERIRNYLKIAAQDSGTIWVLLGGDTGIIPCRYAHIELESYTEDIPSDLYYSDLDGTWDLDGDEIYGEPEDSVDLYPDIFVGRAPVATLAETQSFVTKALTYEKNPPIDYQRRALFFAERADDLTDDGISKDLIDERYFPDGFDPIAKLYERDGNESAGAVLDSMNRGFNLLNHCGHAFIDVMCTGPDALNSEQIDGLANSPRFFGALYSVGCWPAAIDYDCIAEHFVKSPHGGGFFVGNSRYGWYTPSFPGYGSSDLFDQRFFASLFNDGIYHLGATLANSKIYYIADAHLENDYRWIEFELNLLGDPELPLWTDTPQELAVDYPHRIPTGEFQFTVTVTSGGSPVEDGLVCITNGNNLYATGITGADGQVTFSTSPVFPDTISITVTAHNFLPYEDQIIVMEEGPYLAHYSHRLDDGGDGVPNPGELIGMTIVLKNFGSQSSSDVSAILSAADSFITITDSSVFYGNIPAQDTSESSSPYQFTISPTCPNGHISYLHLAIHDGEDHQWSSEIALQIASPIITHLTNNIDDGEGGNGLADPGETLKITVTLKNIGLGKASNLSALLGTIDPYITIISNSSGFADLGPGDSTGSASPYQIEISPDCPTPHFSQFSLQIAADGYNTQAGFQLPIGVSGFSDDMEGGEGGWTHTGSTNTWHLSSHRNHTPGGSYSWYCGSEGSWVYEPAFTAYLISPSIWMGSHPTLSFWTWYVIESGMDYGFLEINGGEGWVELDLFTGSSDGWSEKSYDLSSFSGDSIRIRFTFYSEDDGNQYEGWYIDDLEIKPNREVGIQSPPLKAIPTNCDLSQNYPNPFNPTTTIRYTIPAVSPPHTTLKIYNILGRLVRTLVEEEQAPGYYSVQWDGRDNLGQEVSSGIYLCRLGITGESIKVTKTKKMVLIR